MNRLKRLWYHLTTTSLAARRAFTTATLAKIETIISRGEERHCAEIRVIIETALSFSEIMNGKIPRTRALELFDRYQIRDTRENTGILLYINLSDRKIEIVTDKGIDKQITSETWQTLCRNMSQNFREKQFHRGICHALDKMNAILEIHFPRKNPRTNILPDSPVIL